MMRILVTGGAGYIGSHTVSELHRRGDFVVVLDSLVHGHRVAVYDVPLIEGSIADRMLVEHVLIEYQIEAVIHFAAYKAAGESMQQPGRYFDNNVAGTLALLQAMHNTGVKALIFSSTAAVYGTPALLPVKEDSPLNPENPYAESKLMVERMLHWFGISHGLRFVSLRYFNAAGASLDAQLGEASAFTLNLVPQVMKAALNPTTPLQVFGTDYPTPDGTAIRDYIHVLDLASGHLKALDHLQTGGDSTIVNLGTGQGASVQEVITLTQRISGVDIPVAYTARRPGDPVAIWADTTKARELLGWRSRYTLEDIITTAWRWHSTHLDGYQDTGK